MGKPRIIDRNFAQREALEQAVRADTSQAFRQRCQIVLFKSEGRIFKKVAQLVKQHYGSVNAWLSR